MSEEKKDMEGPSDILGLSDEEKKGLVKKIKEIREKYDRPREFCREIIQAEDLNEKQKKSALISFDPTSIFPEEVKLSAHIASLRADIDESKNISMAKSKAEVAIVMMLSVFPAETAIGLMEQIKHRTMKETDSEISEKAEEAKELINSLDANKMFR